MLALVVLRRRRRRRRGLSAGPLRREPALRRQRATTRSSSPSAPWRCSRPPWPPASCPPGGRRGSTRCGRCATIDDRPRCRHDQARTLQARAAMVTRFHCLATDYDGTLAHHGMVERATVEALERLRASGRRLVMVTGRELDDLAERPPPRPVRCRRRRERRRALHAGDRRHARGDPRRRRSAMPWPPPASAAGAGAVIVATWEPHEDAVLDAIREQGLELQVIFNKGAVMVLPSGVNKATGLRRRARRAGPVAAQRVGVGDAENDHALPAARAAARSPSPTRCRRCKRAGRPRHARRCTARASRSLIDRLLADDLAGLRPSGLTVAAGRCRAGADLDAVHIRRHADRRHVGQRQVDAGDRTARAHRRGRLPVLHRRSGGRLRDARRRGGARRHRARAGCRRSHRCCCEPHDKRRRQPARPGARGSAPSSSSALLPALLELRTRTGRPHWIVVDEAHHVPAVPRASPDWRRPGPTRV